MASKDKCTGCMACVDVCPKQCIHMQANKNGFYYPIADAAVCVDCEKCTNVCPENISHKDIVNQSQYYMCYSNDNNERNQGSSGGVFGVLAKWVIDNGGIVFGAAFSDDYRSLSCQNTDEVKLDRLKKSKYFESNMNHTISKIGKELKKDRWVLFCGTPCQVMGVHSVYKDNYNKLILVDFLCHGVPSEKAYQKYISDLEKHYNKKVSEVHFRSKKYGWKAYCMYILFNDKTEYLKLGMEDPFYKFFFDNTALRQSCYSCNRMRTSMADITLGDFWGVRKYKSIRDTDEGISVVSVHTQKGNEMIEHIKDKLIISTLENKHIQYAYKERDIRNLFDDSFVLEEYDFFDEKNIPSLSIKKQILRIFIKNRYLRKVIYKI